LAHPLEQFPVEALDEMRAADLAAGVVAEDLVAETGEGGGVDLAVVYEGFERGDAVGFVVWVVGVVGVGIGGGGGGGPFARAVAVSRGEFGAFGGEGGALFGFLGVVGVVALGELGGEEGGG
jgi:hypothetical protein